MNGQVLLMTYCQMIHRFIDIYQLDENTRKVILKNFPHMVVDKIGEKYEIIYG